jgi:hypothetical protein
MVLGSRSTIFDLCHIHQASNKALDIQSAFIDRKLGRRYVQQVLVGDDLQVVVRTFRTISSLLEAFNVDLTLLLLITCSHLFTAQSKYGNS